MNRLEGFLRSVNGTALAIVLAAVVLGAAFGAILPAPAQAGVLSPLACGVAAELGYTNAGWNKLCLTAMYIENNWSDPMGAPWYRG